MPKIEYVHKRFRGESQAIINRANEIIEYFGNQGFDLTLRQLFYQFVSKGYLPNTMKDYKRLGVLINDARLAGLVDWEAITDRTRNLESISTWPGPQSILYSCVRSFKIDFWERQPNYVEVWVEKEALAGVVEHACDPLRVPFFSCRGYTSQSEMWGAAQRLESKTHKDKNVIIIHLGDHDPSGIDMTRDIEERLELFMGGIEVRRIALNIDQVHHYNPPPNPAKNSDTRFHMYVKNFGRECWELDALDPSVLSKLIQDEVMDYVDRDLWEECKGEEEAHKGDLRSIVQNYESVVKYAKE